MHAMNTDRGGGGGGGSWRLPPDETLQVQDPKDKMQDVSRKSSQIIALIIKYVKVLFSAYQRNMAYDRFG